MSTQGDFSENKMILILLIVAMVLASLLIGTCSYRGDQCRIEAIKAGIKAEDIWKACR